MHGTQKILGGIILVAVALASGADSATASSRSAGARARLRNAEPVPAFHELRSRGPFACDHESHPSSPTRSSCRMPTRLRPASRRFFTSSLAIATATSARAMEAYWIVSSAITLRLRDLRARRFLRLRATHNGKTAAQIREGIERGDWQGVDLKKYESPLTRVMQE